MTRLLLCNNPPKQQSKENRKLKAIRQATVCAFNVRSSRFTFSYHIDIKTPFIPQSSKRNFPKTISQEQVCTNFFSPAPKPVLYLHHVWPYIVESGNIQFTGYSLLFKYQAHTKLMLFAKIQHNFQFRIPSGFLPYSEYLSKVILSLTVVHVLVFASYFSSRLLNRAALAACRSRRTGDE